MTFTAPHPEPAATGAAEPRAGAGPRPGPRLDALPPPTGPRLDAPRLPRAARPVDWWGWQARVRAATGSARVSVRPRSGAARAVRGALVVLMGLAVLVTGGAAVVGRRAGGTPGGASLPRAIAETAVVSATPLELVGVSDLPAPPPQPPAPSPAVETAPWPARATYPVLRTTVDVIDPSRPAVDRGDGAPSEGAPPAGGRLVRTVVRVPDAAAAGPFPLVVFAHGYATSTAAYGPLLDDLAAAGYVVAAPELPMTSTAYGTPVGARQPAEQVEDLRRVITEITAAARPDGPDSPLRGAVRDGSVVVVGHSDGGMTAAAAAFSAGARDERIGAAVVLSGARIADGEPWFPAGGPALLAVHGDADEVNPFAASQSLYAADRSGSARYLVRVREAGHTDAFLSARTRPALVALVDDFVRATVGADADAGARLPADASVPGVLDLVGS